ncbi:MAG: hypothetical protein JNK61_00275 [Bacteroidia bacterium]|nr:hypothetical protein [Bacteroidia bacterium]
MKTIPKLLQPPTLQKPFMGNGLADATKSKMSVKALFYKDKKPTGIDELHAYQKKASVIKNNIRQQWYSNKKSTSHE